MPVTITMDDLKKRLQEHQYKMTPQRKAVLQLFLDRRGEHLSAEDVYDVLRGEKSDIGIATIYRSLELLAELGLLQRINFDDDRTRYEMNDPTEGGHQHHHLVCKKCGKIIEVSDDLLEPLEKEITKKTGFKIVDHQVKFIGYCKECQESGD